MFVARQIKRVARTLGVDLVPYRPFAPRRNHAILRAGIQTVVDVGANAGQWAQELRTHGYRNRIVSFEPLPDPYRELTRHAASDPLWDTRNVALGERHEDRVMYVASNSAASSSLLTPLPALTELAPDLTFPTIQRVPVRTLDSDVFEPPLLLKLDAQGYEDRILTGAIGTLSMAVLVECEIALTGMYEDQAAFAQMVARLDELGFRIIDLEPNFRADNGRILSVDALFERERLSPDNPDEAGGAESIAASAGCRRPGASIDRSTHAEDVGTRRWRESPP